jgi:hypothetical protein
MKLNMKQVLKKGLPIAVAAALTFSYTADASLAKGKPKHAGGPKAEVEHKVKGQGFSDVEGYWGQESVEKMSALGVIEGYADGTFQPNKPVTHQEAIVMIVRLLGLEGEAMERAEVGVSLPFKNRASIASWAHGHIDVALELDLIEGSHVFHGNKPASRMYVTSLMVKGLGLDMSQYENIEVGFTDVLDLSAEERLQLAVAVTEDLTNGYGDKKFKPNKPVTRGEMAAFLERMKDHLDEDSIFKQRIEGTFTSVNIRTGSITVNQEVIDSSNRKDWEDRTYLLADEYVIYYNDIKRSNFNQFEIDDTIEIILNKDEKVIFIEGEASEEEDVIWENLKGISTFNLKLSSGQNNIDFVYDAEEAEEMYVLSQIDGKSTLLTGEEASIAIKEIVEDYIEENEQFDVKEVSSALSSTVRATRGATWKAKLNYETDTKRLFFDVKKANDSESTVLTWEKDEATLSYTQTKDENDEVVMDLEYKDPETNTEVNYHKEVDGRNVTASGTLEISGVKISIEDTSLEPTIKGIIADQGIKITF